MMSQKNAMPSRNVSKLKRRTRTSARLYRQGQLLQNITGMPPRSNHRGTSCRPDKKSRSTGDR
jgi:hypothetical protein